MKLSTLGLMLGAAYVLAGCGNLDASRRDQALNGLELTARMELELERFRRHEEATERFVSLSALTQKRRAIELAGALRAGDLARRSAGAEQQEQLIHRLGAFVEDLGATERERARLLLSEADLAADALLAPIPSTTDATAQTQTRFAALAAPLPWKTRLKEVKALVDSVRANYEANRKKMEADAQPTPANRE